MKKCLSVFAGISAYAIVAFCLLFICACGDINEYLLPPYDKDGVIKSEYLEKMYTCEAPDNISLYIESSGSMNGLFRKGLSTKFQYDISAVLTSDEMKNRIVGVNIFNNDGKSVRKYNSADFRNKMNSGDFISQSSTFIPNMVETMLKDVDSLTCDVAVFISDMKYSPVRPGGKVSQTDIDQYRLDIKNIFSGRFKNADYSVGLICCESNFLAGNGREICAEFPYYFVIVGKSSKVAWVRNQIVHSLSHKNNVKGCADFNVSYGYPKYTILPKSIFGGLVNNYEVAEGLFSKHCSSILSFDDTMSPVRLVVGVNYNHLPQTFLEQLRPVDFVCSSYYRDVNIKVVEVAHANNCVSQDHMVNVRPNLFLTLELTGLKYYDDDVINICLAAKQQNMESFDKYYGATREGELGKTYLLEAFIDGLKDAATVQGSKTPKFNLQNGDMYIFVSRKNY